MTMNNVFGDCLVLDLLCPINNLELGKETNCFYRIN